MPITSFTGKPGNGKTALMIEHLMAEAKKAERPLWAAGIDGLQPGLASILNDPKEWNAVKQGETCTCHDTEDSSACDAHVIPNGSLIYIDEAWKWFGHLHNAQRQATPSHVLGLAEHRHRGIDFVWTFQQPNQIYPFARGLMADHYHVVRRFGTAMIDVFKWEELNEDVKSNSMRENAQRTTRTLPKASFGAYKSAEVHTIKPKIPWKVIAVPVFLLAACLLGWLAYTKLKPDALAAKYGGGSPTSGAAAVGDAAVPASGNTAPKTYTTPIDYARAHLPRFGPMPWTAPVYDDRQVTADPQLYCMASGQGEDANGVHQDYSCICLTEQGTTYEIGQGQCRTLARRGPIYNPYKARKDENDNAPQAIAYQQRQSQPNASAVSAKPESVDVFPRSQQYSSGSN